MRRDRERTDSAHVISAVRDLNRTELAGESVRATLEALAAAAPGWLASAVPVPELAHRFKGLRRPGPSEPSPEHRPRPGIRLGALPDDVDGMPITAQS